MRLLSAIFANALLLAASFGVGSLLAPLFPGKLSRLDRFASMVAGGLGLLGTVLFLVGMAAFSRTVILVILIPAAAWGCWRLYKEARQAGGPLGSIRVAMLPAAIIAVVLVITFLGGLAQSVGDIKLDAIAYHFLGPRVWLRDGNIRAATSADFEAERKSREIPYVESFAYLNSEEQVKKVLILEPRVPTFYLRKDYVKPIGRFGEQTIPEGNNFGLLAAKLNAYGITHILDVRLDGKDFRVPESDGKLELVLENGDERVYRVLP
jgi:hypothetical protein